MTAAAVPTAHGTPHGMRRLWDRNLERYPTNATRFSSLTIVVLTTVVLYYQFYLAGGVATSIIKDLNMSFVYYVNISVIGYALGALAAIAAGLADRYGRANIVTYGLLVTGLLSLVALPNCHTKLSFAICYIAIAFFEGIILVATPALVRDFSPQLGRASAMGFWTLGPVVGSLIVSIVVSNTTDHFHGVWQDQYIVCGIAGLVVFVLALVGLRELAPSLRDQLMVSRRDRAIIEARARGLDVDVQLAHPFRKMVRPDIIGSAFAISVFLIIYYVAVGFFPVFFETVFGYSQSTANGLGNWFWAFDAGALVVTGVLSDWLRVRKPFMLVGAVLAVVFTAIFATRATHSDTSHTTFVLLLVAIAVSLGITYAPWMASFTETVERVNPALTATGLAVWGLIIRVVIAVTVFFLPFVVHSVTALVDKGPQVQTLAAKYQPQLATLQKVDPATTAALAKNPADAAAGVKAVSEISGVSAGDVATIAAANAAHGPALQAAKAIDPTTVLTLLGDKTDVAAQTKAVTEIVAALKIAPAQAQAALADLATVPTSTLLLAQQSGQKVLDAQSALVAAAKIPAGDAAYLQANAADVQNAAKHSPEQWRTYFWVGVGGEVVFIPMIWLLTGFWSPRKAREAQREHEARVAAELAAFSG
jgi:ACS family D-galactonate transporter-like MFS transporter